MTTSIIITIISAILTTIAINLILALVSASAIKNRKQKNKEEVLTGFEEEFKKASKIIMNDATIYSLKQQIVKMHEKYNKLMMDNLSMRYKLGLPPKDENNTFDGDF